MCQIMPEPIAGTLRTVNGNLRRNDERVKQESTSTGSSEASPIDKSVKCSGA